MNAIRPVRMEAIPDTEPARTNAINEAVCDYAASYARRRWFGLRTTDLHLPPLDGEQSRIAQGLVQEKYYHGVLSKDEAKALGREIERSAASYFARGRIARAASGKSKYGKQRQALLKRDGDRCWLCNKRMGSDCTVEHLVARSNGGTDDLDNLALAHRACNQILGNLSLAAKKRLRDEMQAEAA